LKEELRMTRKEESAKTEEKPLEEPKTQKSTGLFGASALTNPNISLVLNTFAYTSNLSRKELELRNIPGYTTAGIENRKGFNLDAAELFLFAPVDPYFNLYATIPVTEDGAEVLQGENNILFGSDSKPGPHAYTLFAKASFDLTDNSTILFGPSVMTGKTKTDSVADDTEFQGASTLYGLEFTYKWKPSKTQGLIVQSEYLYRRQNGDLEDTASSIEPLKRAQDGLYIQSIYQMNRWRFGARYDVLSLFKDDYVLSGAKQDFGKKPWRASGMLEFNPTEFSLVRLQHNHDKSGRDGKTNHEWLLQFVMGIGAHAAHPF